MIKKNHFVLSVAVSAMMMSVSGTSVAGVTANMGIASQYHFRGVQQTTGAAAQGGLDYVHDNGLYAGVWGSNVGGHEVDASVGPGPLGIEVDYYLGYDGALQDFSYGIGYTLYTYTGDFDTEYSEVNFKAGYSLLSLEFSTGTHDVTGGPDEDYNFTGLTLEYEGISAIYGAWGGDLDGGYFEIGYAREISEIEFGISLINGDAADNVRNNVRNAASDGSALIITISKEFDL